MAWPSKNSSVGLTVGVSHSRWPMEPKRGWQVQAHKHYSPDHQKRSIPSAVSQPLILGGLTTAESAEYWSHTDVFHGDLASQASTAAASRHVGEQLSQAPSDLLFRTRLPGRQVHLGNSGPIPFATNVGESGSAVASVFHSAIRPFARRSRSATVPGYPVPTAGLWIVPRRPITRYRYAAAHAE